MEAQKKIYRSKENYVLAGVCAGLADYFEIDPTLVRIVFIILTIGGGAGLLLYIILAIIMPINPKKIEVEEKKKEDKKEKESHGNNFWGILLLTLGGLLLWNQIAPFKIAFEIFWPTVMIIAGLWLVLRK